MTVWINRVTRRLPVLMLAGLASCGTPQNPLPLDGPTTLEVYQNHLAGEIAGVSDAATGPSTPRFIRGEPLNVGITPASRRSAQALRDLKNDFQTVPNPDIVGYVAPHLNGALPIPGYYTTFPLYPRDHSARPGEGHVTVRRSTP